MSAENELSLVKKAFEEFILTSKNLEQAYDTLKDEANRLAVYLANVIENVGSALLVFNDSDRLVMWNRLAESIMPVLQGQQAPLILADLPAPLPFDLDEILTQERRFHEYSQGGNGSRRWFELVRSDFKDSRGRRLGTIVTITDKTDLKTLQIKTQREDRLRIMGEFAAEVAHEIRNPLASIELMLQMLAEDLGADISAVNLIGRIRSATGTINHIVSNILLYTKHIQPEKTRVDLEKCLHQAENTAINLIIRKSVEIEYRLAEKNVTADFELLAQCLANLILNAAQAVADREGKIVVSSSPAPDGRIKVSVADNGPGIPEEIRDKVFMPFFTTRNSGTGLGLAMVKRVIEAHDGVIELNSSAAGTVFSLLFPLE